MKFSLKDILAKLKDILENLPSRKDISSRFRIPLTGMFFRIWKALFNLLTYLISGIRAKLALFSGSLIFVTVLVLTIITVNQQTRLLTESYSKEVAISRNYISNLVLSLDSITKNIIRLEEFRNQVEAKSKELRKYRTTQVVEVEKEINIFGFKTKLFGSLGKEKFITRKESFYSRYLSKDDISKFESRIRFELEQLAGKPIENKDWAELRSIANQYAVQSSKDNPNRTQLVTIRSDLENRIFSLLREKNSTIIESIGLDTDRFRIQTFPNSRLIREGIFNPSFDSSVFSVESPLSEMEITPPMNESLINAMNNLFQNPVLNLSEDTYSFRTNTMDIEIFYSPLFLRPHSTQRSLAFLKNLGEMQDLNAVLEEDRKIANELSGIISKLRSRLKKLKEMNPPQPPYKDKEFRNLYDKYFSNLDQRNRNFRQYIQSATYPPNRKIAYDSLLHLRDAYWEDLVLYKYSHSDFDITRFQNQDYSRKHEERWNQLRKWVRSATEETVPKSLSEQFTEGIIGKSRSEAEELMWEIDSTPLLSGEGEYLAKSILINNLTGVIRTFVDKTEGVKIIQANRNEAIASAFIVTVFAILLAVLVSGFTVEKIKRIIFKAEEVGKGRLDVEFEHGGNDEFGKLTVSLNQMVTGLREREKFKSIMGAMIDPVVVNEAMKDINALRRGTEREITAFFSDIAGFTTISEKLTSVDLAELLNLYLSEMTMILKNYGGVLDKYIGDAIVGIFNSPLDLPGHPEKAVRASLDMLKRLDELKSVWKSTNQFIPEVQNMKIRIGLNTGLAKVGLMGTYSIASYTMMGDTVNLASRLESAGKDYGVSLMVSEFVRNQLGDTFLVRRLDRILVKGKTQSVTIYEVLGTNESANERIALAIEIYEKGFEAYLNRNWNRAIQLLEESIQASAGNFTDTAARVLQSRCRQYSQTPPPESWDGSFVRSTK